MSVYSNETISRRFAGVFSAPRHSLSHEAKAVLGALAVWTVLLGIIALQDRVNSDLHSNTNVEDLRMELPAVDRVVPMRQHY